MNIYQFRIFMLLLLICMRGCSCHNKHISSSKSSSKSSSNKPIPLDNVVITKASDPTMKFFFTKLQANDPSAKAAINTLQQLKSGDKVTPLGYIMTYISLTSQEKQAIRTLHSQGANLNTPMHGFSTNGTNTPLWKEIQSSNIDIDIVTVLLELGAKVNQVANISGSNYTPLDEVAVELNTNSSLTPEQKVKYQNIQQLLKSKGAKRYLELTGP